jgi:hypothetical protein
MAQEGNRRKRRRWEPDEDDGIEVCRGYSLPGWQHSLDSPRSFRQNILSSLKRLEAAPGTLFMLVKIRGVPSSSKPSKAGLNVRQVRRVGRHSRFRLRFYKETGFYCGSVERSYVSAASFNPNFI